MLSSGGGSPYLSVEGHVELARQAAAEGFPSYWLPQIFGVDAITTAAVIGRDVPGIEVGTAVVPIAPRHPIVMAQQALTASELAGGRFTLGVGLSHQIVIEQMYGLSYERPATQMREYLSVLVPLLRDRSVAYAGETVSASASLDLAAAPACPVLVAALGPKMLELTGELADGTITWMTGPVTIAGHIVPTMRAAADRHGRPTPRVVAGLAVCVTDDVERARERAASAFQVYGFLPSYRAMLDREGFAGPGDFAVVGDEAAVRAELARYEDAGVDDLQTVEFGTTEAEHVRTRELLRSLL